MPPDSLAETEQPISQPARLSQGRVLDPRGLAFAEAPGALERAAHLRGDAGRLAELRASETARVVALWRGRPLFGPEGLHLLRAGEAALDAMPGPEIFLGLHDGFALFSRDVSAFEPDGERPDGAAFFDASEQRHPDLPDDIVFAELRGRMGFLSPVEAEIAATARGLVEWHRTHRFCSTCGAESEAEQAGWHRRCPVCERHHFPRTDPVVIMLITHGNRLLLGRGPHWPETMYSCLAGFMEPGETVEAAVRREVFEESGVAVGEVSLVASQPWPFPASLMLGCRGVATTTEITIDPVEIADARWISRERLLQVVAGRDPEISAPRQGAIAGWLMREWLADRLE
ncbi:NAD(+) diphosphatase [Thioclava sp. JE_KL1]|uniref:NAD(+) diphosphatase n=1 Tax=Thioclava sp. JE_KL1 TaxID=2651187 RepID=UPI00128D49F4|nr:NAD(+) diphosphatase [Thioclava sp. JE_KL1]MPQ92267.1 NAD(+) diphosphatase [Thioclava sp. JE_KL1]